MFIDLKSSDGNIFAILGYATKYLRSTGQAEKVDPLAVLIMGMGSYEEALKAITDATDGYIQYER